MTTYEKIKETHFEETYILFLAKHVLVVAAVNKKLPDERNVEWCAYIGTVKSKDNWENVRKWGEKLPRKVAEVLFPFSETHIWRS